jgi:LmbE family N-acetylglucosaminyl deacetylase
MTSGGLARVSSNRHSFGVARYLYVSPHLDDVALSAGGLVHAHVQAGHEVLVASLCTQDPPHAASRSPLAAQFHEKWGHAELSYEERRHEDRAACAVLGARSVHLDLPDAIYRGSVELGQYANVEALFENIPAWDEPFSTSAAHALELLIAERRPSAIFGPLAVGRHVDHQHVLRALWLLRDHLAAPVTLYEDQPYAAGLYPRRTRDAVSRARRLCPFALESRDHVVDFSVKRAAILCYESQIEDLFGADQARLAELESYGRSLGEPGPYRERVWIATVRA